MLLTYGQIFAQTKEKMDEMKDALAEHGFELAYINTQTATVVKEVPDETEYTEE